MDAASWLTSNAQLRTPEGEFACLEGCGFCCTYPPKVDEDRLADIEDERGRTATEIDPNGNLRLALQGGCGGCVLLEDRVCQAHEHRPDHCRFFPFHVYFGRTVEVVADRVCPGIEPNEAGPGPHEPASQAEPWEAPRGVDEAAFDVLGSADPAELDRRARRVRQTHEDVATRARWEDRWSDPDETIEALRPDAQVTARAWEHAVGPFRAEADAHLPTTVLPDADGFPWRAWRIEDGRLTRLAFTEEGTMRVVETQPAPDPPPGGRLPGPAERVLEALTGWEAFVGACLHLVDEEGLSVEEAVRRRLDDVAAGLALHAGLLEAEDLPVTQAWLRAVYEPEFYTLETLGEWL